MTVYELTHVFFLLADELIYSPKNLGLYYSNESVKQAVQYYSSQPGFCDNPDAFSSKERIVCGSIIDDTVFESIVYLHSEDYEVEIEIELGLYGDEASAKNILDKYCTENSSLVNTKKLIVERILNKRTIEHREWIEGFSVS